MNAPTLFISLTATLLLAACGSTAGSDEQTAASTEPASTQSTACADFTRASDHVVMALVDIKMSVGSSEDQSDRLATVVADTATLAADAPTCAPEAAAPLTALAEQTSALAEAYMPDTDGAASEGIYSILVDVRVAGEQAWQALGKPTSSWEYLPLHEDGSTT